jgi:iron complex transport system ATP-binding protein
MLISVEGVSHAFSKKSIFSSIQAELRPGESVAILGNNGCGKSTLLKIIAGILTPAKGAVLLGDTPVEAMPPQVRACKISWVPAHLQEATQFSALQFVALADERKRFSEGRYAPTQSESEHHWACLNLFDAAEFGSRSIEKLSTGEWKRVQLARAWASRTPILLLDEPTTGLDLRHTAILAQNILLFTRERAGTVVFSSHDFAFVAKTASRIVIIHEGTIFFDGPPSSVSAPTLETVFGVPFREGLQPTLP